MRRRRSRARTQILGGWVRGAPVAIRACRGGTLMRKCFAASLLAVASIAAACANSPRERVVEVGSAIEFGGAGGASDSSGVGGEDGACGDKTKITWTPST